MELVNIAEMTPKGNIRENSFEVNRKTLQDWKACKLVNVQTYVYLALKIDYGERPIVTQKEFFCDRWEIPENDFDIAIA